MINKGTFHMIPRRKGVGSGYDFFALFTSSQRTMGQGWGVEVWSRVWLHLRLPGHAQSLPFISQTQQSSFKLKYADSPLSPLASILTAWPPANPPQSQPHLAEVDNELLLENNFYQIAFCWLCFKRLDNDAGAKSDGREKLLPSRSITQNLVGEYTRAMTWLIHFKRPCQISRVKKSYPNLSEG